MFELLYILQNSSVFPTLYDYAIFSLIMQSDAARGQLCEIVPAHNIRIPDLKFVLYWTNTDHKIWCWGQTLNINPE